MTHTPDGPWYYQQIDLGFNYRMTDLQAALGLSQMSRLDSFVEKREELARRYRDLLAGRDVVLPPVNSLSDRSAFHLYPVGLKDDGSTRLRVFELMRRRDIGVNVHYIPVHLQPYYLKRGFSIGMFPAAEAYYQQVLSLPIHPGLNYSQQDFVVAVLLEALNQ